MTNERKIIRADEGGLISRAYPYSGDLRVYSDAGQLARAAAELFVNTTADSIEARGRFRVALSGGTTPRRLYKLLATSAFSSRADWARIGIFWADEGYVPELPTEIHPPKAAADTYEHEKNGELPYGTGTWSRCSRRRWASRQSSLRVATSTATIRV